MPGCRHGRGAAFVNRLGGCLSALSALRCPVDAPPSTLHAAQLGAIGQVVQERLGELMLSKVAAHPDVAWHRRRARLLL